MFIVQNRVYLVVCSCRGMGRMFLLIVLMERSLTFVRGLYTCDVLNNVTCILCMDVRYMQVYCGSHVLCFNLCSAGGRSCLVCGSPFV